MTTDEEVRALQMTNALRAARRAVATLEEYVADARRNTERRQDSSSVARNMGAAVADLAAASAQIELLREADK